MNETPATTKGLYKTQTGNVYCVFDEAGDSLNRKSAKQFKNGKFVGPIRNLDLSKGNMEWVGTLDCVLAYSETITNVKLNS